MGYFLSVKPDLCPGNNYGGTLLSTIIPASANAPYRSPRDHICCLELALKMGVALPRVTAFLAAWSEAHPGQVLETGVA
jgi:hypothetical protein